VKSDASLSASFYDMLLDVVNSKFNLNRKPDITLLWAVAFEKVVD